MSMAPSIEIILKQAGREAAARGLGKIEPEHLLMAILSVSELRSSKIGKLASDRAAAQLAVEVQAAWADLKDRTIESTKVR